MIASNFMYNVFDDSSVTELSQPQRAPNFYDEAEQGVVITNNCDGKPDKEPEVQEHKQANVDPHYDVLSRGEDGEIRKKKARYVDAMAMIAQIVESLFRVWMGFKLNATINVEVCRKYKDFVRRFLNLN